MDVRFEIVSGRTVEDECALMERHDPGGEAFDVFRTMGRKNNGFTRSMDFFQQNVNILCHFKVETRRRFIQ